MTERGVFIAARPAPRSQSGAVHWLRRHLFRSWLGGLMTLALLALLVRIVPPLFDWAVLHAVFKADLAACRAAEGVGACWGVVAEKGRLILFGRYPFDEQWRPLVACALLVSLLVASCLRACWRPALVVVWVLSLAVLYVLMRGGVLGLTSVETALWGGLPLTLLLSTVSLVVAFPLAILLALGRQSKLSAIRTLCVLFIEIVRGVPLISVLFMASFVLPLFMPGGGTIDVLLRVLVGMTLFTAAYLAEVIRGGLQALPAGQVEAAHSLGLSYWKTQRKIVMPQALRLVVPAIVNTFIGAFKDTSLVTIVSLYDLTGAVQLALGDPQWRRFFLEGELFVAAIYLVACLAMSHYSRWIERHLNAGVQRT
ncbi:amino acid ABC transporter permease [Variovorax sp. UMC13]|uniref:amino acid ABC transporter permease n=1 Tax=Variovorax sp. UMC13 TaxID=1862326 RepID=UPI00160368ED|nr:amino acid ABC transporter permease [Variovorax sp. UMC13]MBB1601007.1 amino acid ABC transporter permease [Variovorax sp. UMC13]